MFEADHGGLREPGQFTTHANNQYAVQIRRMEFMKYVLEGHKLKDIGKIMNLSPMTLHTYLRRPDIREELEKLHAGVLEKLDAECAIPYLSRQQRLDDLANKALSRMEEMLGNDNLHPSLMMKVVDSALDRNADTSRSRKLDVTSKNLTMKGEDLQNILVSMKDIEQRERERTQSDDNNPVG